ncbi:MAG: hypothetical protein RL095_288 [Verrucomicrobiota bacterium]
MKIDHKTALLLKVAFAKVIQPLKLPIFGKLECGFGPQGVRIRACNMDESLSFFHPVPEAEEAQFLIAYQQLRSFIETLGRNEGLEICVAAEAIELNRVLADGRSIAFGRLAKEPGELPNRGEEIAVKDCPIGEILKGYQACAFACVDDASGGRPTLGGVFLDAVRKSIVAADGHHLMIQSCPDLPSFCEENLVLPLTRSLLSSFMTEAQGGMGVNGYWVRVVSGPWDYRCKRIEGQFPTYHRVIPAGFKHRLELGLHQENLDRALRELFALHPKEETVYLALHHGHLFLLAGGKEIRYREIALLPKLAEMNLIFAFNRHYLANSLKACPSLVFCCDDSSTSPVQFESVQEGRRYLLAPMHGDHKALIAFLNEKLPASTEVPQPLQSPAIPTTQQSEEKAMSTTKEPEIPVVSVTANPEEAPANEVQKEGLEAIYDKIEKLIEKQQEARKGLVEAHRAVHSTQFQLKLLIKDLKAYERGQNRRLKEVRKVEELLSSLHKAA